MANYTNINDAARAFLEDKFEGGKNLPYSSALADTLLQICQQYEAGMTEEQKAALPPIEDYAPLADVFYRTLKAADSNGGSGGETIEVEFTYQEPIQYHPGGFYLSEIDYSDFCEHLHNGDHMIAHIPYNVAHGIWSKDSTSDDPKDVYGDILDIIISHDLGNANYDIDANGFLNGAFDRGGYLAVNIYVD